MFLHYVCLLLAIVGLTGAMSNTWDNQLGVDVSFVQEAEETQAMEAVSDLSDSIVRDLSVADFLRVPFDPETDARDRQLFDSIIADPSFHAARAAAIRMNYYMDVPTYDRLHAESLKRLRSLAASLNVPITVTQSYSSILAEVDEVMRKQDGSGKASFAELGAEVSALHASSYLFDGRYTVMSALNEDVVAHGILDDKLDQAMAWLRSTISSNRCSWCKSIVGAIKGRACYAAGQTICNGIVASVSGPIGLVVSKYVCGFPINFAGILAGWCNKAIANIQKLTRVTDTCICSFRAGISVPRVTILGKEVGGFTVGSSSQVCKTNPGECAWNSAKDKKKWNGKSGTVDKPKGLAGKVVDAAISGGVNAGIDGVRGAIRAGIRATAKSLARQGVKELSRRAAIGATKIIATAGVKTAVGEVSDKAKRIAEKGVVKAADKTSKYAAKKYTEVATKNMNKKAAKLTGKEKEAYLRQKKAAIASRSGKIQRAVNKSANFVGKTITDTAVNNVATMVNSKASGYIKNIGKSAEAKQQAKKDAKEAKNKAKEEKQKQKLTRKVMNSAMTRAAASMSSKVSKYGTKEIEEATDKFARRKALRAGAVATATATAAVAAAASRRIVGRAARRLVRRVGDSARRTARAVGKSSVGEGASRAASSAAEKVKNATSRAYARTAQAVRRARSSVRRASARASAVVRRTTTRTVRRTTATRTVRRTVRRVSVRKPKTARRTQTVRRRVSTRRRTAVRRSTPKKKTKAPVETVVDDADLKSKIASKLIRVGDVYKKDNVCYKLMKKSGKSKKASCNSSFYF